MSSRSLSDRSINSDSSEAALPGPAISHSSPRLPDLGAILSVGARRPGQDTAVHAHGEDEVAVLGVLDEVTVPAGAFERRADPSLGEDVLGVGFVAVPAGEGGAPDGVDERQANADAADLLELDHLGHRYRQVLPTSWFGVRLG